MPITNLLVVDNPSRWEIEVDSVEIISAKSYLAPNSNQHWPEARVFNLCRSYAYQSVGYYVSLLAEARGHRALPSVATLRDFRSTSIAKSLGLDIEEVILNSLKDQTGPKFELDVYFGQTLDKKYAKLGSQIYRYFPSPLLRAQFVKQDRWLLGSVAPISTSQIPDAEREQIAAYAQEYFRRKHVHKAPKQRFLYDLAILVNPNEENPPSNNEALRKFTAAAREVGFYVETITTNDSDRISEFDALFIRETTSVNHPTYRLSRLAHAEGLIVIDDPWSILRCANKIFLAESLARAKVASPKTWILTGDDLRSERVDTLPMPCILKVPDAAFSVGVRKVESRDELRIELETMLKSSELILAQEFVPSEYDWRIGVLDHQPLFACKYFMATGHWQIYNWTAEREDDRSGDSETLHVEFVPPVVLQTALKAARLIGDGLYGVDLKQFGDKAVVIEVNDNPNIDHGIEDRALGTELYRRIARSFRRRIELARG
jgi:glutathione synthase/RimK-type ligase-like ATP-grasp enzyme